MNWKKQIRRASRAFALTALAFLVASATLFGLVQTDWGIRELARWVSSLHGELTLQPDGVSGFFPFRFELHRLTVRDPQGVWLEAGGLKVHWSVRHLTKGQISFKDLALTSLNFHRLPVLEKRGTGPFPSWIFALRSNRFSIDQATIGKELLGEPAVLKLDARLPVESPGHDFEASLRIERTDHAGTILLGSALVGSDGTLRLDVSFEEKEHGVVGKALGTQGPLKLSLLGEGSAEHWAGRLHVTAPPWGQVESDWVVEGVAVNPTIRSQGRLSLSSGALPPPIRVWLDGETPFDLQARLLWGEAIVVERFELRARDLELTLGGRWDLGNPARSAQFRLSCKELKPLKEVLGFDIAGTLYAEGAFSAKRETVSFSGTGSIENFQVRDSGIMPGKAVLWELRIEGSPREVLFVKRMKISTENLSLEGAGEISISDAAAALEALYEVEDLRLLSSLESLAGWSTQGKAHLSWNAASSALSSRLQGKLQPSHRVSPPLFENEFRYAGTLSFQNTTLLNLSEFEMVAPWAALQGDASIDLQKQSLKGSGRLLLQDLGPLSPSLKGGHAEVRAAVEGPFSALTLSAEVTARDLSVSELQFDTAHASLHAETGALTQGNIRVQAQGKELSLRGQTHFDLSDQRLNLTDILLEGGKSTLAGHLSVFLFKPVVEGELKAECNDLTALSSLIREKAQGSAVLTVRLFPSEEGQGVSLLMEASNLEVRSGKALRSRLEAQGTPWASVPQGHITLDVQNGRVGDLKLSSSAFILEGDLQKARFQLSAAGHYRDPFEIKGSGSLAVSPDKKQVTLTHFGGQYGSIPFSLLQALVVTHSSKKIDFGECLISLGSGRFLGSGWIHPEELSLELRFDGVPLRAIPLQEIQFLDGVAHGSVQVSGNPASLEGTATLQVEKMRLHEKELPSAGLTVQSSLRQNFVGTTVLLRGLSTRPLELHLENHVYFSLSPLVLGFPPQSEIRGTLRGEMLLETISGLVELREQKLSGIAQIDLALEGPVRTPRMTGWIHLKNGSYENLRTGTLLREIEADLSARTPMLVVNKATATDGEKGRVSALGRFDVAPGQGFPFKLDLALEKAKPFRYDSATAVVGGDLTLTGSLSEAMLTGQLRVDSAEFRIPERPAPEIQDLQVIEINKPGETQRPVIEAGTPRPWPLSLNLHVLSPGRIFLSGRGLDSEWQGEIRIEGEATQPLVAGALSLVRGSVSFMGKRFELKKGSLFFDGSSPPSPTIDVEAESKSREITAYLHLSGSVQSLEIKLTSDPPLPPDEILSHLLFDRSASKITPPQAVQLAGSMNALTGGGGFDPLARTRQLLGLDQLTLKQTGKDMEQTALSAGKYLSEEVYIEVEQGISPETGKASLKWEITPDVSVETEVGVNAEAGVGINWRWDY